MNVLSLWQATSHIERIIDLIIESQFYILSIYYWGKVEYEIIIPLLEDILEEWGFL
jgi:hypothetical protein